MSTTKRLLSLDVFRGLTIAFMILVNCPGSWSSVYGMLLHAEWHGCTPTDLVFPFFLFIVGIAISFSLSRRKAESADKGKIYRKIISRTLWIIGIGLLLNGAFKFNLATWRIPGVLFRIGIVYGICAMIYMVTTARQQLWIAAAFLLGYWALMTLVPVPGQGYASLEMGKDLGAWLDRLVFGGHVWRHAKTWDPEGLLSTVPALATCIGGILAGTWIRGSMEAFAKWTAIFAVGFLLVLGGLLWGEVFPINKQLWTSSYGLYHSGWALLTLGTIWWLVDVKGYKGWTKPFVWFGMNPLFIFVQHSVIVKIMLAIKIDGSSSYAWIYNNIFLSWLSPKNASLAFALMHVGINLFVAWVLYKKKVFIKV